MSDPIGTKPHAYKSGSSLSPLASVAAKLVANGYSPLPIKPSEKMPGAYNKGAWYLMRDWSRFCTRQPTEFELRLWRGWPDANVGLACGRGLLAFDIDRDDLVAPILAVLPPVKVAKKGRKGLTVFYQGNTDVIRSRGFAIDKLGCMDLISDGKQTVIPPSIHPNTGEPYVWDTEDTLLTVKLEELPFVDESHVEAVVEVLKSYGYRADDQGGRFVPIEGGHGIELKDAASEVAEFFRTLNEDALANLHTWVPRIGLSRLERRGDNYRSVAEWRPSNSGSPIGKRPLHLAIHKKGIVDYGGGEKTYTPLNLVMAAHDLADYQLDKAAVWLGECLGYDFSAKIVLNRKRKVVSTATVEEAASTALMAEEAAREAEDGLDASDGGGMSEAEFEALEALTGKRFTRGPASVPGDAEAKRAATNVVDIPVAFDPSTGGVFDQEEAPNVSRRKVKKLSELTRPPGYVGELVDWIAESAEFPSRELALSAALGWVAALAGRGFAYADRARTNLYMVALAPSGFGKDHAPSCIMSLAQATNLDRFLGPARFMSASGLREAIREQPSLLAIQDEYGGILRQMDGPKVGIHNEMIRYDLLGLFSRAKDLYAGAAYAGSRAVKLYNPNLCILGMSTPDDFWSAMTSARSADGFLARYLVFDVSGPKPARRKPSVSCAAPSKRLVDGSLAIYEAVYSRGNLLPSNDGTKRFAAQNVGIAVGAEAALQELEAQVSAALASADPSMHAFYNRVFEHAVKLGLTIAVGDNPNQPVISEEIIEWAADLAWLSAETLAREAEHRMADNDRQRSYKRVIEIVRRAGKEGISFGKIVDKLGGTLDKRTRNELIEEAEQTGRIMSIMFKPKTGRPGYRFVVPEFLPDD